MTANNIIPTYKDDQKAIRALANADESQIISAADELLEWMQDGNWPVSLPIGKILSKHLDKITSKIVAILQGNDSAWKYCCIRFLLMNLKLSQIPVPILDELKRIEVKPTVSDILEETVEAVKEILSGY
ncbi:MAG: DUF5071 domain-containing protein [Janthinobacterium lividum]